MAKKSSGGISINKVSFWLLLVAAVVYLVNMILHLVGIGFHNCQLDWSSGSRPYDLRCRSACTEICSQ